MNMENKNKYILTKALINIVIIFMGAVFVSFIIRDIQQKAVNLKFENDSKQVLSQTVSTLQQNREDANEISIIYHTLNQSSVDDLQQLLTSGLYDDIVTSDDTRRTALFKDIIERANVEYLFIMDKDGNILVSPDAKYLGTNLVDNHLLTKSNLDELISYENNYVKDDNVTGSYYFYSSAIPTENAVYYLVYGTDATIFDQQFASLADVSHVIQNVSVGAHSFTFAIDLDSNTFINFESPYDNLTGKNCADYGLSSEIENEGVADSEKINGVDYVCVSQKYFGNAMLVVAVEQNKMYESASSSWKLSIIGFIIISLLALLYASIVRNDHLYNERETNKLNLFHFRGQSWYLNVTILKRIMPVVLLGILMIFGISYYSATTLEINSAMAQSDLNLSELQNQFINSDDTQSIISEYYQTQFLSKAKILAYLFEENPAVLNNNRNKEYYYYDENNLRMPLYDSEGNHLLAVSGSSLLAQYCYDNHINAIYLFDEQGRTIATNMNDWYFQISFNKDDQSYPFRDIIDQKIDEYIQQLCIDEQGRKAQYIGTAFYYYTTTDANGDTLYVSSYDYLNYCQGKWEGNPITKHHSLLQIGLSLDVIDTIINTTDYVSLMEKTTVSEAYLSLFDNSADHICLYSPREESIGKIAQEIGLSDNAFNGNYYGFQKVNGFRYLVNIRYNDGYYIGNAILDENLFTSRAKISLVTAGFGALFVIIMSLFITISNDKEEELYTRYAEDMIELSDRIMFKISTPTGKHTITEKAASRWDNKNIPWSERTPEQKLLFIFFLTMVLVIFNIIIQITLIRDGIIENNVFLYIFTGNWDKGFNIFALTACILVIIMIVVATQLINVPVVLLTSIFGSKSETIGHLLTSIVKAAAFAYSIFYCLYLLGFDSMSLLASAGILSLVIGLGSQTLITDVIAGIFIIFEGSFRVGDIVTIDDYRGQVLDVGLRTIKIMATDHNIKIINNSAVTGVVNMTRVSSLCMIEVPVQYSKPVEEIEEILKRELPLMKDKIDKIIDGAYYNGIKEFNHETITVIISALCKESDITEVRSGMNKEILSLLARNGLDVSE